MTLRKLLAWMLRAPRAETGGHTHIFCDDDGSLCRTRTRAALPPRYSITLHFGPKASWGAIAAALHNAGRQFDRTESAYQAIIRDMNSRTALETDTLEYLDTLPHETQDGPDGKETDPIL